MLPASRCLCPNVSSPPIIPSREHTGTAESIYHLVRLLLVVKLPSLIERASGLSLDLRTLVPLSPIEAIEDEDQRDP